MKQPETQENNPERPPALAGARGYAFPSAKESDEQLQRAIDADIAERKENPHWREMTEVEESALRAGWAACFLWIERHNEKGQPQPPTASVADTKNS